MVLTLTEMYLLSLGIHVLVVYDLYPTLCSLIAICKYLFLLHTLSDIHSNLLNKVIMSFLLISKMLIYIFLLLSVKVIIYILFGNTSLVSGQFCHLGWLMLLEFSIHLLNLYSSFTDTEVFVVYILMIY